MKSALHGSERRSSTRRLSITAAVVVALLSACTSGRPPSLPSVATLIPAAGPSAVVTPVFPRAVTSPTVPVSAALATATATTTSNATTSASPTRRVLSVLTPTAGSTVGIAESIVLTFPGTNPTERSEIEQHLTISTSVQVEGAWAWVRHNGSWSVHWRPSVYWPAGARVQMRADLAGLTIAPGVSGAKNLAISFTIGRAEIVLADTTARTLAIERSGQTVSTYPAGYRIGSDRDRLLIPSGIHVVSGKEQSASDSDLPPYRWAVAIGAVDFVGAQGTTAAQFGHPIDRGIQLSVVNAKAFYQQALIGDPVEVSGTAKPLTTTDDADTDWTIPWGQWLSLG